MPAEAPDIPLDDFDEDFYLARYPGVRLSGMPPADHFRHYGIHLDRQPNPDFNSAFYRVTYTDVDGSGYTAFEHYLRVGKRLGRPASARAAQAMLDAEFQSAPAPATAPGGRSPTISYCIPIMDRLDDLRQTLPENLAQSSDFRDRIEFVVATFGTGEGTGDWLRDRFPEEFRDGYLRLIETDRLDGWHFAKAKNAFRGRIAGRIYSSLDGDNFVTREETAQLLSLVEAHGDGFLMHHFRGTWGDGTSGRVSIPRPIYENVGYDELLLPRQYDELDLILGVMRRLPAIRFVGHDATRTAVRQSRQTAEFLAKEGFANPVTFVPEPGHRPACNRKPEDYARSSDLMSAMLAYNQACSFLKHRTSDAHEPDYRRAADDARMHLLDHLDRESAPGLLFETAVGTPPRPGTPGGVTLVTCARNDGALLHRAIRHYRGLGVRRFLVVDDRSDTPLFDEAPDEDVHVFRPKVGRFLTAKALWMGALVRAFVPDGAWALTVDTDELVDLPAGLSTFDDLARDLSAAGEDFAPGLLLDMLPDALGPGAAKVAFDRVCWRRDAPSAAYADYHSIRWGFGAFSGLSWAVDARYHAFGTFDSLRKIPFFRARRGRHLNQGFHTLHHTDGSDNPGPGIWSARHVLPVRHYKIASQLEDRTRAARATQGIYHPRSAGNIDAVLSQTTAERWRRYAALPSRPYAEFASLLNDLRQTVGATRSGWRLSAFAKRHCG